MRTLKVLMAVATIAALGGGAAYAQQPPSDTGTDANGPITILKNMQAEPAGVQVTIDGAQVDDLSAVDYADITGVVHRGQNTLTYSWSGPVRKFNFKIAYAPTRNNFKNVVVVQTDASRDGALRKAGSRTVTFTIPG